MDKPTGLSWFDRLRARGNVPVDDNLRPVALLCTSCYSREKEKVVAWFVVNGQSLCEECATKTNVYLYGLKGTR